jgi:hypothetical protein
MTPIRSLSLAALAAVSFAGVMPVAHAQPEGAIQVALASPADHAVRTHAAAARPLAVMLDQPTGGRFVYLPEQGWTFAGRQADAPVAAAAAAADAGQPVSLFIDEPTGFVFNYVVEQGWVFAGKLDAAR